jgi:hypothetical protein
MGLRVRFSGNPDSAHDPARPICRFAPEFPGWAQQTAVGRYPSKDRTAAVSLYTCHSTDPVPGRRSGFFLGRYFGCCSILPPQKRQMRMSRGSSIRRSSLKVSMGPEGFEPPHPAAVLRFAPVSEGVKKPKPPDGGGVRLR